MTIKFNVPGSKRKELVKTIAAWLGEDIKYCGAPTFAYEIDYFTVDREGNLKFGIPATNLQTKGDSISFSTPTIEGTVMRRNKLDENSNHPWKAEVTEGETGVDATTVSGWFSSVYEPEFSEGPVVS